MDERTIRRIVRQYGKVALEVRAVQKGYRNESYPILLQDGRLVNLIVYKHEPGILATIRRVNAIGSFLDGRDLPVRVPIDNRIIKISAATIARYACLYTYLPGQAIPWESYTRSHIKLLGGTMARLHTSLAEYDGLLPHVTDEYRVIVKRMERYFADAHVARAATTKLGLAMPTKEVCIRLSHVLTGCEMLADQHVLHMDFVRSNILFADGRPSISGIIDFEKAAYGHPLFDVARTLAFLLVDCKYKPSEKVRKYFLDSGYCKRGQRRLERVEIIERGSRTPLLEVLLEMFLLYDFYKFLCHNPYESLSLNEHFARTRDLLLERGVITTTPIGSLLA